MDSWVFAAVLLSALLHAGWNAVLKVKGDRLLVMTLITNSSTLVALCIIPFVAPPTPATWPYLMISVALQGGYHVFLIQAYRHGDLGQVYPIARGVAPVLVLLPASFIAGDSLSLTSVVAVMLIAAGVGSLAFRNGKPLRDQRPAILYALGTASFIAAYTVADGLGVRAAGSPHGYMAWLFALGGIPLTIIALTRRRRAMVSLVREYWPAGLVGGTMSLAAYWLILWALTVAPMAQVAAIRETSVVFAAILAAMFLKEGFGGWRIAASCAVAAGVIFLRL
jgi:drug/metabolite transporter (DMT)-like permease